MPITLEKPKTQSTVRQPVQRDTQSSKLTRRLGHDQSRSRTQKRQRAALPTARRSTATHRQGIEKTHVRQQPQIQRVYRPSERKQTSTLRRFIWPFTLEKCFTMIGFATGLMLLVLFTFDLAFEWPFMKVSVASDVMFVLSGLAMLLSSWDVAKDQIRR